MSPLYVTTFAGGRRIFSHHRSLSNSRRSSLVGRGTWRDSGWLAGEQFAGRASTSGLPAWLPSLPERAGWPDFVARGENQSNFTCRRDAYSGGRRRRRPPPSETSERGDGTSRRAGSVALVR